MKQKRSGSIIPWSKIRSDLRRRWMWGDTRKSALHRARVKGMKPIHSLCALCGVIQREKLMDVDHIIRCGNLKDDPKGFIERLWCDPIGLQILCEICHTKKGEKERAA